MCCSPTMITAVVDAHHPVREGETVELVADPSRLWGFDPQTGRALGRESASVTLGAWEGSPRSESTAFTSATGR
jgi:hypothetical protein